MIRAVIDAPWIQSGDTWRADYDGGYTDVTGEDWYEWPVGSGQMRKGGNYPPGTQPGEPENAYLQIKVVVEDDAALAALDADDRYWVYWSEEISDGV